MQQNKQAEVCLDYKRVCRKAMSTLRGEAIRRQFDAEELAGIGYVALAEVRPETEALGVVVARRAMLGAYRERMKLESKRVWSSDPVEAEDGDVVDAEDTLLSSGGRKLQPEAQHVDLWEAMRALPAAEYRAITLHFWGNKTQAEIADETGVSQQRVAQVLASAKKKIREALVNSSISATSIVGAEIKTQRTVLSGRKDAA